MPQTVDISILIVNWNSKDFLQKCLASIYKKVQNVAVEIIVIDNNSCDGSSEMCRKHFPLVNFIQSDANLGFSGANNVAFRKSSGSTILFLNPDTEILDDNAVALMLYHLHSADNIGAVGCRVLNSDLTLQFKYVQAFPTIINQSLGVDLLIKLFPSCPLWGFSAMLRYDGAPLPVQVISGSCVMVKRQVYEEIGGFDEDYFMYAEDVALCYAIHKAGYAIHYVGGGSVIHHSEKSSSRAKETYFSEMMQRESLALFFLKTRGPAYAWLFRLTTAMSAFVRFACIPLLAVKAQSLSTSRVPGVGRKWWKLLRWAVGLEKLLPAGPRMRNKSATSAI